jgi:arylsulfatase A-like enzyme
VTIAGEPRPLASLGLETVEIEDRSGTTAYHVPEGILAVYDPTRPPPANTTRAEVSVLEVAPTLLQTLGVDPPSYMTRPKLLADLLPV